MKKITKSLMMVLMAVMFTITVGACSSDNKEPDNDLASKIDGVYTGQLTSGGSVIEDVYVVTITKISSTAVTLNAKFFSEGSANFNVSYANGVYSLTSANQGNMTCTINNKTLTISFLNKGGTMTTFSGVRD